MQSPHTDDSLMAGEWTWEEMRERPRRDLSNHELQDAIEQLCRDMCG
jgi:hypothetical protein